MAAERIFSPGSNSTVFPSSSKEGMFLLRFQGVFQAAAWV
jgi:hypothetical protein